MDQLKSSFDNLSISKRTLYYYMTDLWIFTLKRVQLEPVERNTPENSIKKRIGEIGEGYKR